MAEEIGCSKYARFDGVAEEAGAGRGAGANRCGYGAFLRGALCDGDGNGNARRKRIGRGAREVASSGSDFGAWRAHGKNVSGARTDHSQPRGAGGGPNFTAGAVAERT